MAKQLTNVDTTSVFFLFPYVVKVSFITRLSHISFWLVPQTLWYGLFLYPNKLENMKCVDINMERVTKIDSTSERPEQRRRFKKLKANENQSAIQETPP